MKFMSVVYGLVFFIVGAVIVLTVLPALLPTFYSGLNSSHSFAYCATGWNATAGTCSVGSYTNYVLPLQNLFALNGILPLVLVAGIFTALVIGAIAMIKGGKKR